MIYRYVDEDIDKALIYTLLCVHTHILLVLILWRALTITAGFGEKAQANPTCTRTPGCERSWSGVTRITAVTERSTRILHCEPVVLVTALHMAPPGWDPLCIFCTSKLFLLLVSGTFSFEGAERSCDRTACLHPRLDTSILEIEIYLCHWLSKIKLSFSITHLE